MIAQVLDAHARAINRRWITDRDQTVGASEVGGCLRRAYFAKHERDHVLGRPRNAGHRDGWGALVRGQVYEDRWFVPALRRAYGRRLHMAGADQRTLVQGFLSATPDGLIEGLPRGALADLGVTDLEADCLLVECKSIDPRTRLDAPKPEHAFQAQAQLGLVRALTRWRPLYCLLVYTNASFWDEVREFPVRFDPDVFARAKARATAAMTAASPTALPAEGVVAGGGECRWCPFTRACGVRREAEPYPAPAGQRAA